MRQVTRALGVCCLSILAIVPSIAQAQNNSPDRDLAWYQKFVNAVGETVYFFAWPTATYERVSFQGFTRVADGADAKLRVHGISAIGGGPLWTDVVIEVRNGRIHNLYWGENNALLFKPGESIKKLGEVLKELNRQYNRQVAVPRAATLLANELA
jgi:hypothetical protein